MLVHEGSEASAMAAPVRRIQAETREAVLITTSSDVLPTSRHLPAFRTGAGRDK